VDERGEDSGEAFGKAFHQAFGEVMTQGITVSIDDPQCAALAAGYTTRIRRAACKGGAVEAIDRLIVDADGERWAGWRPHVDPADSYALQVDAGVRVTPYPIWETPKHSVLTSVQTAPPGEIQSHRFESIRPYGSDRHAATRMAILDVAAMAGRHLRGEG
jgi:hypothetical protein